MYLGEFPVQATGGVKEKNRGRARVSLKNEAACEGSRTVADLSWWKGAGAFSGSADLMVKLVVLRKIRSGISAAGCPHEAKA